MSSRRLNKEFATFPQDGPIRFITLINDDMSRQKWQITPSSGDSIAFDGVTIGVTIEVPPEYPFRAPKVTLDQSVYHPNVHEHSMCLSRVTNWTPKSSICEIMEEVLQRIMYPDIDTAVNQEAATLYVTARDRYINRAINCDNGPCQIHCK